MITAGTKREGSLPFDWDANDLTKPYTAVGMLAWAICSDLAGNPRALEATIEQLQRKSNEYDWG